MSPLLRRFLLPGICVALLAGALALAVSRGGAAGPSGSVQGLPSVTATPDNHLRPIPFATGSPVPVRAAPAVEASQPQAPDPPSVSCQTGRSPIRSRPLGISLCIPSGWGPWTSGAAPDALSAVEDRAQLLVYSDEWFPFPANAALATPAEKARVGRAVKLRLDYAPSGATFAGCTPGGSSPVAKLPSFCEDVYDITSTGETTFTDKGALTAWKFLLPVSTRVIDSAERSGGSLYVKVVFPTADRDRVVAEIEKILGSLEVR